MEGFVSERYTLSCRLDDGLTTFYPQAMVYNRDGTLVTTKNLSHASEGLYLDSTWIPPSSGYFSAVYTIYTDAGRTLLSPDYNKCTEGLFIGDLYSLSSQVFNLSSILEEIDYISSQIYNSIDPAVLWISSAVFGISTQIKYNPPGAGATAAQVWEYTTRELTTVSSSDETAYISTQIGYVSSQLRGISSQVEIYGGGGGGHSPKSYVAYTSKQSPWKYREKESLIKDVRTIMESLTEVNKKAEHYHDETAKDIVKSEKSIITNINQSLSQLNHLKKSLEDSFKGVVDGVQIRDEKFLKTVDERDVKLLNSVDTSIKSLTTYKSNVEEKFKSLEDCLNDILLLLGTVTPIERIEELEEEENEEHNG